MGAAALILLGACDHAAPISENTKWEYMTDAPIDRDFVIRMNELGADGWEIVTLRRVETTADDLPAMRRGYVAKNGASEAEFDASVWEKSGKMKYETVLKRARRTDHATSTVIPKNP